MYLELAILKYADSRQNIMFFPSPQRPIRLWGSQYLSMTHITFLSDSDCKIATLSFTCHGTSSEELTHLSVFEFQAKIVLILLGYINIFLLLILLQ